MKTTTTGHEDEMIPQVTAGNLPTDMDRMETMLANSQVPLSKEENDILYRNAKKIKKDEEKLHGEEWPMLGTERVYQKAPGTSFVEKLKGTSQSERMMEEPVGGGVSGSSSEQSSVLGKDLDIAEEWRVVHRPRRQKKTGKEAKQDHVAVRDVAVEVNTPRNPTSVKQMREKKSETKKKMRKEQLQVREKGVQKQSKQELRKEKRARDVAQGEQQNKGILSLTGREGDLQDKGVLQGKGELQSLDKEERGQRSAGGPTFEKDDNPILGPDMGPVLGPVKGPDLEHIARGCVDVGETETQSGLSGVGGPKGKFWAASSSVEADLDLVLEESSGDVMDTVVQDTQF
ncbi:hypothetical protein K1719_025645 [Acacia pycnantha]|nr:hypothetical protein K1719_025645 [Acacia pycnantha]